jgi:release factor glutamine methyltransferase
MPPDTSATIARLLSDAVRQLASSSSTPHLDAELLLAHVLGWSRTHLLAHTDSWLDDTTRASFADLVARRANLEPIAYLIGSREFYGLDLLVDRRVLVPRPETELLVDLTIERAQERPTVSPLRVVDVGTGSGAIAVALAMHLPDALIYATDRSTEALAVAAANVARHALEQRVRLLHGDLLSPLPEQVDIIVSNPPYTILSTIDANVWQHEPHLALDGGPDGLAVYRRLVAQVPRWLRPDGCLLLEIGAQQEYAVASLVRSALQTPQVTVHYDMAGHPRVLVARARL